jgi:hypothetical protein
MPACVWFVKYLTESKEIIKEILLENKSEDVRSCFSRLLDVVISQCCVGEADLLDQ